MLKSRAAFLNRPSHQPVTGAHTSEPPRRIPKPTIVQFQHTIGNRAVARMLNAAPQISNRTSQPTIQRVKAVYSFDNNQFEDAELWDEATLRSWRARYLKMEGDDLVQYYDQYELVNQELESPRIQEEMRFDQLKTTQVRDPQKVKRAIEILGEFSFMRPRRDWAFSFDQDRVVEELQEVVKDPSKMDQKQYPVCGTDTYLRLYAIHHPDAYVRYVIDLLTTGVGQLGDQVVVAPTQIKEKELFANKMRISDWVATSSLRSQENKVFKEIVQSGEGLKKYSSGVSGMTSTEEVKKWFKKAGIPGESIDLHTYNLFKPAKYETIGKINEKFQAGWAVALSINDAIVDNPQNKKIKTAITYHFVTLASDIRVTSDGNNLMADIYTWGQTRRIRFRTDQIGLAIVGFVAADMSQLPVQQQGVQQNNQNNQNNGGGQTKRYALELD